MRTLKPSFLLIPATTLLLAAEPAPFKDPTGVWGVIDRVVFEPAEANAERIQLWGVFALSRTIEIENDQVKSIDLAAFEPARRGYLYYTVNREDEASTRADWAQLKAAAGTGHSVGFGGRLPPNAKGPERNAPMEKVVAHLKSLQHYNGRVRRVSEPVAQPDVFPLRMTERLPANRPRAAYDVMQVPEPLSPTDGGTATAGRVRLVTRNVAEPAMQYVFEIEDDKGVKETSAPIARGDGQTTWSPTMRMQAGTSYTWRVWVRRDGTGEPFSHAEAAFRVH
jgi:hypothetical protein